MNALIIGTLLALGALSFVLYPLLSGAMAPAGSADTIAAEGKSQAIDALREIEFDRATGKLSDSDYAELKASYTAAAITAMRTTPGSFCSHCGYRTEADAKFCSRCGAPLHARSTDLLR